MTFSRISTLSFNKMENARPLLIFNRSSIHRSKISHRNTDSVAISPRPNLLPLLNNEENLVKIKLHLKFDLDFNCIQFNVHSSFAKEHHRPSFISTILVDSKNFRRISYENLHTLNLS